MLFISFVRSHSSTRPKRLADISSNPTRLDSTRIMIIQTRAARKATRLLIEVTKRRPRVTRRRREDAGERGHGSTATGAHTAWFFADADVRACACACAFHFISFHFISFHFVSLRSVPRDEINVLPVWIRPEIGCRGRGNGERCADGGSYRDGWRRGVEEVRMRR